MATFNAIRRLLNQLQYYSTRQNKGQATKTESTSGSGYAGRLTGYLKLVSVFLLQNGLFMPHTWPMGIYVYLLGRLQKLGTSFVALRTISR